MPLYGGIDLHANNSVVVLLNDQDQVIYQKRLAYRNFRCYFATVLSGMHPLGCPDSRSEASRP